MSLWITSLGSVLLAWCLARAMARAGEPCSRSCLVLLTVAMAGAFNPFVADFVASRDARYLDVSDLQRSLALGALCVFVASWPLWRSSPAPTHAARGWSVALAMLCAGLLPTWIDPQPRGSLPLTNDEHAYLYQAQLFADGTQTAELGEWAEFYTAPQTQVAEGKVFSKYPPGHSALLAIGTSLGWAPLVPRLLGALCPLLVFCLARRMGAKHPDWAAWLFALSPYYLGVAALQLSHGTALPLTLLMVHSTWCALDASAERRRSALAWAALAGLAFSWAFAARPVTALAMALPLLVLMWREKVRHAWALLVVAALASLPAAYLFWSANLATTGDPLQTAYGRYNQAANSIYGAVEALEAARIALYNLGRLESWLLGLAPSLVLVVLGITHGPRAPRRTVLIALPWVLVAAYLLHPFHGIPWCGPVYWVEGLPYLCISAAAGLECIDRCFGFKRVLILACGMLVGSAWLLQAHFSLAREEVEQRNAPWRAAQAAGIEAGVVFVPLHEPNLRKRFPLTPPAAGARLVFARDLGPRNERLLEALGHPPAWNYLPDTQRLVPR